MSTILKFTLTPYNRRKPSLSKRVLLSTILPPPAPPTPQTDKSTSTETEDIENEDDDGIRVTASLDGIRVSSSPIPPPPPARSSSISSEQSQSTQTPPPPPPTPEIDLLNLLTFDILNSSISASFPHLDNAYSISYLDEYGDQTIISSEADLDIYIKPVIPPETGCILLKLLIDPIVEKGDKTKKVQALVFDIFEYVNENVKNVFDGSASSVDDLAVLDMLKAFSPSPPSSASAAAASSAPSSTPTSLPLRYHPRHVCDNCQQSPIYGVRHRSTTLNDFDLCGDCFKSKIDVITCEWIEIEGDAVPTPTMHKPHMSRNRKPTISSCFPGVASREKLKFRKRTGIKTPTTTANIVKDLTGLAGMSKIFGSSAPGDWDERLIEQAVQRSLKTERIEREKMKKEHEINTKAHDLVEEVLADVLSKVAVEGVGFDGCAELIDLIDSELPDLLCSNLPPLKAMGVGMRELGMRELEETCDDDDDVPGLCTIAEGRVVEEKEEDKEEEEEEWALVDNQDHNDLFSRATMRIGKSLSDSV